MLQTLAKVFSWKNKQAVSPAIKAVEDDIPRYPPFAKGLPSASVDRVVQTQDELVSKIKGMLRFNTEEFGQYVLPVISRYAAHVHLLPASESHHHRGAGGLLRHGLEVGFWAAQQAESKQFTLNGTPQDKRNNEPKWQLAAFLGGLLHDVGKPLSDLAVVDESGNKIWNPYSHSLIAWANAEQVDRYFLRWRDKRHKRHETFSLLNIDRILTPETRSYLSSTGPEILEAMLESIAGTSAEQALTKIVMWADQQSVARDLKQHRLNVDEHAYGVPVERYVFDAMRRLIKSGRWKVNEPGGKVWLFQEGVFVAWKHAVKDIAVLIQDDQIPGVPRDADTLADILIERGYALTFQDKEDGLGNRYWPIRPTVLDAKGGATLYSLRLDSLDLLFTDEPPTATKGYVGHAALKMKSKAVAGSEAATQQNHKPTDQQAIIESASLYHEAGSEQWNLEQPPMDYPEYDNHELLDDLATPPESSPQVMPEPSEDKENHPAFASNPLASIGAVAGEITATNQFTSATRKTKQHKPEKADSNPGKQAENASAQSNTDEGKPVAQEVSVPELSGDEGVQYLKKAVSLIANGTHTLGQALYRMGHNRYSILYPDGAKLFGKQTEVMKSLDADGLLEPDPVSLKKVQEQNGIKMLVLSTKASQWVEYSLQLIEQGELLSAKAQPMLKEAPSVAKPKATTKPSKPAVTSPSKNRKDTPEQKQKVPAKRKSKAKAVKLDKPMAEPPKVAAETVVEKSESSGASQNEFSVKMQIENIVKELKFQIKTGEGRWIVGSVDKWEGGVAVDIAALDKILEEYPFITKRKLRSKFIMNSAEWGLSSNKLTLKEQG